MPEDSTRPTSFHSSRRQILAATGGAALAGLAGCIGGNDGSDQLKDPIELYTWNLPFLEESINGWMDQFKKEYGDKYDGLEAEWTDRGPATGDVLSYFQSRLQSDDPVNIFDTQMTTYTRYAKDDIWVDLNQFADEEFLGKYYDKLIEVMTYDDKLVQMPFYMGSMATYSRKKWFDETDLDPPTTDNFYSTMDYLDAAEQLVENSGAKFGLTFIRYDWQLWPWFQSEGIDVLNDDGTKAAFNTNRTREILSRFRELTEKGVIPEVSWTGEWKPAAEQFGAGDTAMFYSSTSALRLVQNTGSDWVSEDSVVLGGAPRNGRYGGPMTMHGLGAVKPKTSEKAHEASFDFISVIVNKKWQKDFLRNTTVLVPHKQAVKELQNDSQFVEENPLLVEIYKLWDAVSADVWVPPLIEASSEMSQTIDKQFSAAALGEKSVDEAINTAEQQINQALNG
ncbi:extracellular solute-binding protein [Haladaptatus pallidirubidus]|uniref:Extracellular solute-binding protein n=2 Tax=Haladaptatus pallidirubidus TaxID=1008152 RepID=A0AAV3UJ96_9EURY